MMSRTSPPFPTENEKSMSEKVTDVKDKLAAHIKGHRDLYIAAGAFAAGLVVAGTAGAIVLKRTGTSINVRPQIKQILSYKPEANQSVVVRFEERANLSKPCRIKGSMDPADWFISTTDASDKLGVSRPYVSGHLHGRIPDINGIQLEWIPIVDSASQN